jgi:hypothetical protein
MRQPIRTSLLLSVTALLAAACTNMPMEGQGTSYNNGYTAPATTGNVPEAGPLSDAAPAANTYAAAPAVNNQVPAATAPQHVPVATVPQVPMATAPVYDDNGSPYDVYAASSSAAPVTNYAAPVVDYSQPQNQPQPNSNDSYTSYGPPANTAAAATDNYYTDNSGAGYDTYTSNNTGYSNTNTYAGSGGGGSAAIQVFATGSAAKAERIRQDMQGLGLPAVVDQVAGLYKVRIPYSDAGAARANLNRVRMASGESGAFVTTR